MPSSVTAAVVSCGWHNASVTDSSYIYGHAGQASLLTLSTVHTDSPQVEGVTSDPCQIPGGGLQILLSLGEVLRPKARACDRTTYGRQTPAVRARPVGEVTSAMRALAERRREQQAAR
eukprot:3746243-Prymnesium_polylepis.1